MALLAASSICPGRKLASVVLAIQEPVGANGMLLTPWRVQPLLMRWRHNSHFPQAKMHSNFSEMPETRGLVVVA